MAQKEIIVYKSFITVLEMMEDRGYDVSKYSKDISIDDFHVLYTTGNLDLVVSKPDNEDDMVYIKFFVVSKSLAKKDFTVLSEKIKEDYGDIKIIIIAEDYPPAALKKDIAKNKNIQFFLFKQLVINITKHVKVPKHTVLSEEEAQTLVFDRYKCTRAQLPKILATDPVAKYYDMKQGQICKIVRPSISTGEVIVYRVVR